MKAPPPTNKGERFPPEPLETHEVHALLDAAPSHTVSGLRIRGLIGVLYGAGLRINEALSLQPRDVDLEHGMIRVRHGKGNRDRLVGIDPTAASLLQKWMDQRKKLGFGRRDPIFVAYRGSARGKQMTRRLVARQLNDLAVKADIDKRVHPHGLRHSFAFQLANENTPVHLIQRQLGHSSLMMTEKYISHLNPRQVVDMMRERDWGKSTNDE